MDYHCPRTCAGGTSRTSHVELGAPRHDFGDHLLAPSGRLAWSLCLQWALVEHSQMVSVKQIHECWMVLSSYRIYHC